MAVAIEEYLALKNKLSRQHVQLIAVSKTKPITDIQVLYDAGQRDFGENYVQELVEKQKALPAGIHWHFIGHLQSNKVKIIAPFVHLIHGVDSLKLLKEINKEAAKNNRLISVLLQVHIAREETKFGLDESELNTILSQLSLFTAVRIKGLMGMASFSDDKAVVKQEFDQLKHLFDGLKQQPAHPVLEPEILSMGMSGDYEIAIAAGSNMVRIGSLLFGAR